MLANPPPKPFRCAFTIDKRPSCHLWIARRALVAELVDALVSGTSGESRGGSSPLQGTKKPVSTGFFWV
jgi:hypothetical protein